MIRFGIIGTSNITEKFLSVTKGIRKFKLTAVYSRNIDRAVEFGSKYGATHFFDDLEEFAGSDEFDAVYIASPNSCHYEQSMLLMKNKKHVLCEKPLASNVWETEEMFQAAHDNGVVLLEAMRSAFAPEFPKIRNYFKKLGKIRRVDFHFNQYSSQYNNLKKGIMSNRFLPECSGGALMDLGCYCIYPMVFWFGMPKKITGTSIFFDTGVDAAGTLLFDYGDMIGEARYSKICDDSVPCEIQGEKAVMQISHIASTRDITVKYPNGFKEIVHFEQQDNNMEYEVRAFMDMVRGDRTWDVYEKASKNTAIIMEEARKQMGIRFPSDKWEEDSVPKNQEEQVQKTETE